MSTLSTFRNAVNTAIKTYSAIVPSGYTVAEVINPVMPDLEGLHQYGACPICGHACHDGQAGWLRSKVMTWDTVHLRRIHLDCLLAIKTSAEMRKVWEGAETKVGKDIAVQVTFQPDDGSDSVQLAAVMMTPNRLAGNTADTSGRWYRNPNGAYISPMLRNLKWQGRLETAAKLCKGAIVTVDIYLEGKYKDSFAFSWHNKDERGRWVSKDKSYKHGFLVKLDWEVGKYRNHGLQQYNYHENIERAKLERDYGKRGRKRFWL